MGYEDRFNNIFLIDTKMFGFEHYMSAYLVEGKELALVDTGVPASWESLSAGIKKHGFSINDITRIFVCHEHADHYGNVSKILEESPRASVYIHPLAKQLLAMSEAEQIKNPFTERAGVSKPTPHSRIRYLHDGELLDLGNNEVLEVIFTPGHQPGGITFFDHKNSGLFINDLIGNYFADAEAHLILLPLGSDIRQQIASMQKLMNLSVKNLYLGHFGIINDNSMALMSQTLNKMQQVLEIGTTCMRMNRPDLITSKLYEFITPYIENMRRIRGEAVYNYMMHLHLPFLLESYTEYCKKQLGNPKAEDRIE